MQAFPALRFLRAPRSLTVASLLALAVATLPQTGAAQTGPGTFEIDELAAERALERALVQSGSVLLGPRTIEVVPFVGYLRRETETVGIVTLEDGETLATSVEQSQNEFSGGLFLRAGLPWPGQVELTLPLAYTDADELQRVGGVPLVFGSRSVSGIGDVVLTYTHRLLEEGGGLPTLLGSVTWDTTTGREADAVGLGTGFNEVELALTATVSQDPLVFSGRLGYQRSFERRDIRPGDQVSFSAAAFLAVNPETSLSFGLSLARADRFRLDGQSVPGSDLLAASLDLGLATVLRRDTLLTTSLSVGLTDDAPAFAIQASLPITFRY